MTHQHEAARPSPAVEAIWHELGWPHSGQAWAGYALDAVGSKNLRINGVRQDTAGVVLTAQRHAAGWAATVLTRAAKAANSSARACTAVGDVCKRVAN